AKDPDRSGGVLLRSMAKSAIWPLAVSGTDRRAQPLQVSPVSQAMDSEMRPPCRMTSWIGTVAPAGSVVMTASLVQVAFDADVRSAHVSAKALAVMDT